MLFSRRVSRYLAIANVAKLFLFVGLAITFGVLGFREAARVLALSQLATISPSFGAFRKIFRSAAGTEIAYFGASLGSVLTGALINAIPR
jgi:hypothetical protein